MIHPIDKMIFKIARTTLIRWRSMNKNYPIFIGGASRSGTTLLVDMLGLHPNLSPIYETDFVLDVAKILFSQKKQGYFGEVKKMLNLYMDAWSRPLPNRPHKKKDYEKYHHGYNHILFDRAFIIEKTRELSRELPNGKQVDLFRRFVTSLFEEHCRKDSKSRWVSKNLSYVKHLPFLKTVFSDMKFLHCIRDGRDIACSLSNRSGGVTNSRDIAVWWLDHVKAGIEFGARFPSHYIEIKYEDLIREPEKTLNNILIHLDENDGWKEIAGKYRDNPDEDSYIPLSDTSIERWKDELAENENINFQNIAGKMLDRLNYPHEL